MTRKLSLTISILLFTVYSVFSQNETESWTPSVDLNYAFGGNFYLNYLESNPMWSAHLGMDKMVSDQSSLGFRTGYEGLDEQGFIPILLRFSRLFNKDAIYLHGGYAFGIYDDIDSAEQFSFKGGLALGAGYIYQLIKREDFSLKIKAGYDHRNSTLDFSSSNGNSIKAKSRYHYLNLGACLSL